MKVEVDPDRCQGHTLCRLTAPAVYELDDDDGHAHVVLGEIPDDLLAAVRRSVAGCPEQAITLSA